MTSLCNKYKVKVKVVQEQWPQVKIKFSLGFSWGELTFGGRKSTGEAFCKCGMSKFSASGMDSPHPPGNISKMLNSYILTYQHLR